MKIRKDLTGKEFGYLKVMSYYCKGSDGHSKWKCQCICGRIVIRPSNDLKDERRLVQSCGCKKNYDKITHGMYKSPEYRIWADMLKRCYNPNSTSYPWYGALGVKVCTEWHLFENFYRDMGDRYSTEHTLERLDPYGDYCNDNCVWDTRKVQANNRRDSG